MERKHRSEITLKQAAIAFFRVFSLYVFLTGLHFIGYVTDPDKASFIVGSLLIILVLIVSFSIWRFAPTLRDRLLSIDEQGVDSVGIAILALQVVGVYLVFSRIPRAILYLAQTAVGPPEWSRYVYPAQYVVVGLIVWRFSKPLGARLAGGLKKPQRSPVSIVIEKDLQAIAFSVVGVFLLAVAINDLVAFPPTSLIADAWRIGIRVLEMMIGAVLVIGTEQASRAVQRFRDFGLDLESESAGGE